MSGKIYMSMSVVSLLFLVFAGVNFLPSTERTLVITLICALSGIVLVAVLLIFFVAGNKKD